MTKLEQKLIELGYDDRYDPHRQRVEFYKKMRLSNWWIRLTHIMDNDGIRESEMSTPLAIRSQQDIDDIQQAFNQLQKDLEVLKDE